MTRRGWWKRWMIGGVMLGLLSGLGTTGHAQEAAEYDQVRLRYASFLPASHVREILLQQWMDEVTKRSDGRVTFDAFRDQALLGTRELLDGASRGISDVSFVAAGYHPTELPLTTMLDLPYLTNNAQTMLMTAQQMFKEFGEEIGQEYDRINLVLLASVPGDPTILAGREPWNSIADIKGKRIRAFGLINQVLESLGAIPVALPAPDIYASMERGVIEGYSGFPATMIPPWALHEVSEYIIDTGAGMYANVAIVMNKTRFEGLNEKTRKLLVDTFAELVATRYMADLVALNEERAKVLTDAGMKFLRWPREEREKARTIVTEKVWEDAINTREARGVPARKFFTRLVELIDKNEPLATDYIDPVSVVLGRPD
jgi:TRAP-type transport system periplasmic protein